ncbi:MFS transporter [Pseudochryseolinea flava]|uniref:MFS transporter n=1 Tax=Pseudochryseolinea flava TaxID=2059302 RepID=A0A364Y5I2_9BACT|nr:MFS transporter [Pseudochryseolinea flava]RAW02092.1 hypothetical protein DQQ10_05945 [Pseudochryseolinea flava]
MKNEQDTSVKSPAFAALALAFASFGDAFLYPFLPVNFDDVGVPIAWVGVLLSINRVVRIISATWLVHAFAKYGLRAIMIVAVVLALTSTFGYGMATSVVAWIFFRVMWGLAFSAMRIGVLGYALQHERVGFALGVSRGLQESGPMITLMFTPWLLAHVAESVIFYVLAALSIPALYFAFALPRCDDKTPSFVDARVMCWPSTLNAITLVSSILIDGMLVVVLGSLFLNYRNNMTLFAATSLAAFYLGYRRICLVALSPVGGWLANRFSLHVVFMISIACVVVGLFTILAGWIGTGVVVVFTFYSVNSAITPACASKGKLHSLAAVAENATWRDIGAALGTLLGGFFLTSLYLNAVILITIFVLIILLFIHLGSPRKAFKVFYLWK